MNPIIAKLLGLGNQIAGTSVGLYGLITQRFEPLIFEVAFAFMILGQLYMIEAEITHLSTITAKDSQSDP